jgi:hypothetical protein
LVLHHKRTLIRLPQRNDGVDYACTGTS